MCFLSTGAVPKACPLSIDGGSDGVDALDGNLGDDDGDTWSQGEDDPYLGVTWHMGGILNDAFGNCSLLITFYQ